MNDHDSSSQHPSGNASAIDDARRDTRPETSYAQRGVLAESKFWRGMAVLLVAALFYIGHGLAAQNQRGGGYTLSGSRGSGFFENAAFADGDTVLHIHGGDVDTIVTAIDDGETLLLWIFGSVVSGVPQLKEVVRFTR